MTKFASLLVVASFALAASATATAAEEAAATLRVDRGNVMTSQGGDFATAQSGQTLVSGERLMVTEDSAATVTSGNDCTRTYTTPGVYVVELDCERAVADGGMGIWAVASAVGLGVAAAAALGGGDDDSPPVSR